MGWRQAFLSGQALIPEKRQDDIGKDVQKFRDVLTQIQTEYVDTVNTNDLVDDAIHHMLNKLDPHSAYIPATDRIAANEDLRGNFDGIGVEFNIFHDTIVVVSALKRRAFRSIGNSIGR